MGCVILQYDMRYVLFSFSFNVFFFGQQNTFEKDQQKYPVEMTHRLNNERKSNEFFLCADASDAHVSATQEKAICSFLIFIFHLFCVEHEAARQEGKPEKNVKEVLEGKKLAIHANNHIYKINKRIQWNSDGCKENNLGHIVQGDDI